jgi:hypothetical protein
MLYHLFYGVLLKDFSFFNVFRYISFRALLAGFTALLYVFYLTMVHQKLTKSR